MNDIQTFVLRCFYTHYTWLMIMSLLLLGIIWNVSTIFRIKTTIILEKKPTSMIINKETMLQVPFFGSSARLSLPQASQLSLKVIGILYTLEQQKAQVIIQTQSGFDKVYRVGDTVQPGVMILSIEPREVIILHQGKKERLSLPQHILRFDDHPTPLLMKE